MREQVITAPRLFVYSFGVLFLALFMFVLQPSRADAGCCVPPAGNACVAADSPLLCRGGPGIRYDENNCGRILQCGGTPLGCCVTRVPINDGFRNECAPVANEAACSDVFVEQQCRDVQGCSPVQQPAPGVQPAGLGCTQGLPCLWQGLEQCLGDQKRVRNAATGALVSDNVCGICEIFQLVANALRMLFAFVGGLALVMVVWGAFGWIKSQGNEEAVEAGKKTMVGALIGIALVLGAWTLVNFAIIGLGGNQVRGIGQVFGKPWNIIEFCEDKTLQQ